MTTPTPAMPPQWPYFIPTTSGNEYSHGASDILSNIQRQGILDAVNMTNKNVYDRGESLATNIGLVGKSVYDRGESLASNIDTVNKNV